MDKLENNERLQLNRRQFGKLTAAAFLAGPIAALPGFSLAKNPTDQKLHGLSAFGILQNPKDYTNFGFVNVDAPKGGTFNYSVANWAFNQNPQTFDTLNSFVLQGNAPPRMEICFDSLMVLAVDEPSAVYCSTAESVEISADRNTFTFSLRKEARWHDDTPLTAHDVAYSYQLLKKDGHPEISIVLANLQEAKALDDHTVALVFNGKQSDRNILTSAVLPILSKSFYEENDFLSNTQTAPLGSGPYKVKEAKPGVFIEYERVENYWAKGLPFARGLYNFDVLRIEFYRDRQAAFEAFKKGNIVYREEFTSKTWATEYDFPALKQGKVIQKLFDGEKVPSFQAWAVNQRRSKFSDPRTVQAIGHCFDFEWTNENFFFNAYQRGQSFFEGSEFSATGRPEGEELTLLKSLKAKPEASVFENVPIQPVSNGTGRDRKLLRKAFQLFKQAGWVQKGKKLVDAKGEPLTIEFLIRSPTFERILGKFVSNLKTLGVEATIRLVDPAQYQKRLDTYDFDISGMAFRFDPTPTSESMVQFFGSSVVNQEGNRNFAGISNPSVDELITKINAAQNREELTIILKALDRVLRSTHSWIPNWNSANHRVAYWDMFSYPETKPDYFFLPETYWWFDAEKAKAIGKS